VVGEGTVGRMTWPGEEAAGGPEPRVPAPLFARERQSFRRGRVRSKRPCARRARRLPVLEGEFPHWFSRPEGAKFP
jgi:hypothetical protein